MDAESPEFQIVLDLLAEDSRPNVCAGELEVRPPDAPTTGPDIEERGRVAFALKRLSPRPAQPLTGWNGQARQRISP